LAAAGRAFRTAPVSRQTNPETRLALTALSLTPCHPPSVSILSYGNGDYVKVEFSDETTGVGEWMWVRVTRCDELKKLLFGMLDNEPLNNYEGKVVLGSELAISYSQILEHRKSSEFKSQ
jgi:hypothetical protein